MIHAFDEKILGQQESEKNLLKCVVIRIKIDLLNKF